MWPVSQVNLGLRERVHDQLLAWTALLLRPDGWWQICANNVWNSGTCLSFLRFFFSVIKMGVRGVFFSPIVIWVSWRDSAWYSPNILVMKEKPTDEYNRMLLMSLWFFVIWHPHFSCPIYSPGFFFFGGGSNLKIRVAHQVWTWSCFPWSMAWISQKSWRSWWLGAQLDHWKKSAASLVEFPTGL